MDDRGPRRCPTRAAAASTSAPAWAASAPSRCRSACSPSAGPAASRRSPSRWSCRTPAPRRCRCASAAGPVRDDHHGLRGRHPLARRRRRLVADGRCDLVLAGGAESLMTPTSTAAFTIMRALSPSGAAVRSTPPRRLLPVGGRRRPRPRGARGGARPAVRALYGEVLGRRRAATPTTSPRRRPGRHRAPPPCMRLRPRGRELTTSDVRPSTPRHLDPAQRCRRGRPRSTPSSARTAVPSRASRA
jgi:hypothetical protein